MGKIKYIRGKGEMIREQIVVKRTGNGKFSQGNQEN